MINELYRFGLIELNTREFSSSKQLELICN